MQGLRHLVGVLKETGSEPEAGITVPNIAAVTGVTESTPASLGYTLLRTRDIKKSVDQYLTSLRDWGWIRVASAPSALIAARRPLWAGSNSN